jgi:IS5 family transposase
MLVKQGSLPLSPYTSLYDLVVPEDHLLRKLKELVDFTFIYKELKDKYCEDFGRPGEDPIRVFKYLLLKILDNLSDVDVVERARTDMAYKFFLDITPEAEVIHSSTLTKFRRLRLNDGKLLELLINKSVELAIDEGLIKSRTLIVDSTHSGSRYNQKSPIDNLLYVAKEARKALYKLDPQAKERMPEKIESKNFEEILGYVQEVAVAIDADPLSEVGHVKKKLNLLKEVISDDIDALKNQQCPYDKDARRGYKSEDSSYFGYKNHLAMTPERIIVGAVVTTGEKPDGKQLETLVEQAKTNGIEVDTVVGDAAYSEKDNIESCGKEKIKLVSKLSKSVTHGMSNRKSKQGFEYNKDADHYVCPAGHMSYKKENQTSKKKVEEGHSQVISYYFDVEKCRNCSMGEDCYKEGAKKKTYCVTIKSHTHQKQAEFQESDEFKELSKCRYMIEAKNNELKNVHGLKRAHAAGLLNMDIQAATTIYAANLKRILTLKAVSK